MTRSSRRARFGAALTVAVTVASGAAVGVAQRAEAEAGAGVKYPAGASATRFSGLAFDACDAPSVKAMKAWRSSPYKAVAVYSSGDLRACNQRRLTADWVREVSAMGWKLVPIDVGLQAPCSYNRNLRGMSSKASKARKQGAEAAKGAVKAAERLGFLPGSALYSDLEPFEYKTNAGCVEAVRAYLSGWTETLHSKGFLAGAYGDTSLVRTQAASYDSTEHSRLDAVWSARWDGKAVTKGWSDAADARWPEHQRMKQYRGDHNETHGGYRINIDSNIVDAPVATVAQRHDVTGATVAKLLPALDAAAGPSVLAGAKARLVCRTKTGAGDWVKQADGSYLPMAITPTAKDLPLCTLPFQVTDPATGARSGPDRTTELKGILPTGYLTWTTCEAAGTTLGKPGFWQKTAGGVWVSSPLTTKPDPYARHPALPLC